MADKVVTAVPISVLNGLTKAASKAEVKSVPRLETVSAASSLAKVENRFASNELGAQTFGVVAIKNQAA
jgi:protoporphyrinogen oxidase